MGVINLCSKTFIIDGENMTREKTLVRDCFALSAAASPMNTGILFLATKSNQLLCLYDFNGRKFVTPEWILQENFLEQPSGAYHEKELYGHVLDLGEKDIYVLYFMSDHEGLQGNLSGISQTICAAYAAAKKYATAGDLVLTALDNVNDAISLADPDGVVRYANKACISVLETTEKALKSSSLHTLVTSGKSMLLEVIKSKKSIIDMEYSVKYGDKKFYFINSGYPVFGEDGTFLGAIDIFRGMERTKRLANSMAGYEAGIYFEDIIYQSEAMEEVVNMAKLFARSSETVLILGESGVGKELFAQSIHNYSDRKDGPFIAMNCANFVSELIDSELFGYESGAFTGASKGGKLGKFMLADGGTIFLDEIGEMPIHLQAKLLRVLETMCVTKVGGNNPVKVDVRIIAATNRDLFLCTKKGTFRSDLYYRLKVLSLEIPPLRARAGDITSLVTYFVEKTAARMGREAPIFSGEAIHLMEQYDWPGNIREFENIIAQILFARGDDMFIDRDAVIQTGIMKTAETPLFLETAPPKESGPVVSTKKEGHVMSREEFLAVYTLCGANKKKTAEQLGLSRPTVYKLLKEYEIE